MIYRVHQPVANKRLCGPEALIARLQLPRGTGIIPPLILLSRIDGDAPGAQDDQRRTFGWFESRLVHTLEAARSEHPNLILRSPPFAEVNPIRSFFHSSSRGKDLYVEKTL